MQSDVDQLNELFLKVQARKRENPETKTAFYTDSLGSLLNAYREGDIEFDDCILMIKAACMGSGEIEFLRWAEQYLWMEALRLKETVREFSKTIGKLDRDRTVLQKRRETLEKERKANE